jgi:cytochrome P450
MALNPEVQRKAQEEIDRVIGSQRLPSLEDRSALPYVEAVYREIMRWNPPLPLLPHRVSEDDWYKGYFIPKGMCIKEEIWRRSFR